MTRPAAGTPPTRAIDNASESLVARNLVSGKYRWSADGDLEKRCDTCVEYWPADSEFFYGNKYQSDGLWYQCKACYLERRYPAGRVGTPHHDLHT